jgi:hypothetical protein
MTELHALGGLRDASDRGGGVMLDLCAPFGMVCRP